MRISGLLLFSLWCCSILLSQTGLPASDAEGAKSIKFGDAVKIFRRQPSTATTKPKAASPTLPPAEKPTPFGVQYQIQLTRDNQVAMVPPTFPFVDGDIIHLRCDLNEPSYVYILQTTLMGVGDGSKGMTSTPVGARKATPYKLLYPLGDAHKLPAGKDQIIPDDVTIQMDNEPGTEKLYVVISKDVLDLASLVKSQQNNPSLSSPDGASVDELTRTLASFRSNTQVAALNPQAKGFNAYKTSPTQPVSYALTQDPGKPIVAVVTLEHHPRQSK